MKTKTLIITVITALILIILFSLYYHRHYLFTEIPNFSGSYSLDQSGKKKMSDDSIAFISHKFVDEMRAEVEKSGNKLSEKNYNKIEKDLSTCVRDSIKDKDTNNLDLKQFIDTYFLPCGESLIKKK